jgi:hypothetical protein
MVIDTIHRFVNFMFCCQLKQLLLLTRYIFRFRENTNHQYFILQFC